MIFAPNNQFRVSANTEFFQNVESLGLAVWNSMRPLLFKGT